MYDRCVDIFKGLWSTTVITDLDAALEETRIAKSEYDTASTQKTDVDSQLKTLQSKLDTDYGRDREFTELDGKCFQMSAAEYTYEICPFADARQKQSSTDTVVASLGHFNGWLSEDGYSVMRFTDGLQCWNGPKRSVVVKMKCGAEHRLVTVTEPNKCEYEMEFETPCVCRQDTFSDIAHDEL